jgi:hypothetical protein
LKLTLLTTNTKPAMKITVIKIMANKSGTSLLGVKYLNTDLEILTQMVSKTKTEKKLIHSTITPRL